MGSKAAFWVGALVVGYLLYKTTSKASALSNPAPTPASTALNSAVLQGFGEYLKL